MSLNKFIGIGNLTRNPEVRTTPRGDKVASFGIAMNESYKDKQGQKVEKVEFISVVMWRGLAGVAEQFLKKGSMICVEGKLQTRSWDDPKGGGKKYTTEVLVNNMEMLGGKTQGDNAYAPEQQLDANSGTPSGLAPNDDLPF